jgi:hypothetical protein
MNQNILALFKIRLHYLISFKRIPWKFEVCKDEDVYRINGERYGYGGNYGKFEYLEDLYDYPKIGMTEAAFETQFQ